MRTLYVTFLNEDIRPGYKIKIHSQCGAFYRLGYESYLLIVKRYGFCLYSINQEEKIIRTFENKRERKSEERNLRDEFFLFQQFSEALKIVVQELNPEIVYIRRVVPATPWLINSMKFMKKQGAQIIYEYPSYPWKMEMIKGRQFLLLMVDLVFYRSVEKAADVIGYMGEYHGRNPKFIRICNGVDVNAFKRHERKEHDGVNLIGVAHVAYYHGYDRVIRGLAEYYANSPKERVEFHIVGPVDEKLGLRKLAEELHVQDFVVFHGFQVGQALDDIFDMCDIGVGSLALFRLGQDAAPLKSREYLARGIPTLMSGENMFGDTNADFFFHAPEQETPIDLWRIISEYYRMKSDVDDIRKFAENNLSWEKEMKKIEEKIND